MDLYHHTNPLFTKWIVDNELLEEAFTVMDVGCQGGPHPRRKVLGDFVDFHGHLEQRMDVSWALDLLLAPAPNPRL